jgi:putative nucleotidyltransferase with HDIG domain
MVNSPFFGLRREISRIRDAVMVLGYQNLRSMVIATNTARHMRQDFSCYGHEPKGLWKHSVSVAAAAKSLAAELGEEPPMGEEIFIAALLHDIGKMVLGTHLAQFPRETLDGFSSITAAEQELLGITHGEAGALVAAKWNLSPLVSVAAEHHHEGEPDAEFERYISIIRLADSLMHEVGTGYSPGRAPTGADTTRELKVLGFDDARWAVATANAKTAASLALTHLAGVYN